MRPKNGQMSSLRTNTRSRIYGIKRVQYKYSICIIFKTRKHDIRPIIMSSFVAQN